MYSQPVYGYGQEQQQGQSQQKTQQQQPHQQKPDSPKQQQQQQQQQQTSYPYDNNSDNRNLPNFGNYMMHSPPYKPKDSSLLLQQQQYPTYNTSNNFTSQDIVAGLTQPVISHDIGRIVNNSTEDNNNNNNNSNNSELPTLPPLNKSRERWVSAEDPSVLMQYQNDRRLMSPYQQPSPRQPMIQQPMYSQQNMFNNNNTQEMGPYGCGVMGCFATFSSSNGLFYHMKNVHPNVEEIYKPYRCAMPNCPKRYKNINGLQYHLRDAKGSSGHGNLSEASSKAFQCQIPGCKKAYRTQNGLRYHQQHGHNNNNVPMMMNQPPQLTYDPNVLNHLQQEREKWL